MEKINIKCNKRASVCRYFVGPTFTVEILCLTGRTKKKTNLLKHNRCLSSRSESNDNCKYNV